MKTTNQIRNMLAGIGGFLLLAAGPAPATAQGLRIWADQVSASVPYDSTKPWYNATDDKNDELYFILEGASTHQGAITIPRITPTNDDHWEMVPGGTINSILLYDGFLGKGQAGAFTFAMRDADSHLFQSLASAVQAAAGATVAVFVSPSVGLSLLQSAASNFVSSLSNDGDNTIAAFQIKVMNQNGVMRVTETQNVQNALFFSNNGTVLELQANGAGANYYVRLRVELVPGRELINQYSGLCLDVPGFSTADGIQIQEYACNNGSNQRWVIVHDTGTSPNAGPFTIVSENSGKCLDVRSGNTADGAAVQQYHCQNSPNQQWNLGVYSGVFTLFNVNSNKCIDVPGFSLFSGTKIQQYTCNAGGNQLWNVSWF